MAECLFSIKDGRLFMLTRIAGGRCAAGGRDIFPGDVGITKKYYTIAGNYDRTQREGEFLLLYCQTCADNEIVRSKSSALLQVIIVDYLWERVKMDEMGFNKQLHTDHKRGCRVQASVS